MQNFLYLFDHVICIEGSEQILTLFYFLFFTNVSLVGPMFYTP